MRHYLIMICLMVHHVSQVSPYKPDKLYFYNYESQVHVFAPRNRTWPTNFTLSSSLAIKVARTANSSVDLFKLKFLELDLTEAVSFGFTAQTLKAIQESIFSFEWDNEKYSVLSIQFSEKETRGSILFKKGLIDLFNVNLNSKKEVNSALFCFLIIFFLIIRLFWFGHFS